MSVKKILDKTGSFGGVRCARCEKLIFPTTEWVYKIRKGVKLKYYCSWHCYREVTGGKDGKRQYRTVK